MTQEQQSVGACWNSFPVSNTCINNTSAKQCGMHSGINADF